MGAALQEMSKSTRSVGLSGPLGPPTSHSEVCPSPASRGSVGRSIRKPDCGGLNLAQVARLMEGKLTHPYRGVAGPGRPR